MNILARNRIRLGCRQLAMTLAFEGSSRCPSGRRHNASHVYTKLPSSRDPGADDRDAHATPSGRRVLRDTRDEEHAEDAGHSAPRQRAITIRSTRVLCGCDRQRSTGPLQRRPPRSPPPAEAASSSLDLPRVNRTNSHDALAARVVHPLGRRAPRDQRQSRQRQLLGWSLSVSLIV
jgi:hypothetical protein